MRIDGGVLGATICGAVIAGAGVACAQDVFVTVAARKGWQPTAIVLDDEHPSADLIDFEGKWKGSRHAVPYGIAGVPGGTSVAPCLPLKTVPPGSLIGRVGEHGGLVRLHEVGAYLTGHGRVYVRINDCDGWLSDNSGTLRLDFHVQDSAIIDHPPWE